MALVIISAAIVIAGFIMIGTGLTGCLHARDARETVSARAVRTKWTWRGILPVVQYEHHGKTHTTTLKAFDSNSTTLKVGESCDLEVYAKSGRQYTPLAISVALIVFGVAAAGIFVLRIVQLLHSA